MVLLYIFLIGLCVGSFLNVLIDRLPKGESVIKGRSHCDHCKRQLEAIDLIPVISYFAFGGMCRTCRKPISLYYPFIEVLTAVTFILIWIYSINNMTNVVDLAKVVKFISLYGVVSSLIVIFFADLKYRIIPDEMLIALLIFSTPTALSLNLLPQRILASIILFGLFYLLYHLTKSRGIGFGDVKYAGIMGYMLGLSSGLIAVYIAFVVGGLYGLLLILFGKKGLKSKIAFGPFLIGGTLLLLFCNSQVITFIHQLFGINL